MPFDSQTIVHELDGGSALIDWFGRPPRFHDGTILDLAINTDGSGVLKLYGFQATGEVDAKGYWVLGKHAVVTFGLVGICAVHIDDQDDVGGLASGAIIFDFVATRREAKIQLEWDSSYGISGSITAVGVNVSLVPGKPEGFD